MTRRITFDLDPPMAAALDSVVRQANEAAPPGEEDDHNALARSMLEMLLEDENLSTRPAFKSYPQEIHTMSTFKDDIGNICAELKAAADSNDMRRVHEVHAKLAARIDEGEAPESAQTGDGADTSAKPTPQPQA